MKILFSLSFPNPFPGAAWTRIGFLAKFFKRKGYRVYISGVFTPKSIRQAGLRSSDGVTIFNIKTNYSGIFITVVQPKSLFFIYNNII